LILQATSMSRIRAITACKDLTLRAIILTNGEDQGSGLGYFNSIKGISVDATGNVYVADSGNSRIQEFSSSGAFISYGGNLGTGNGQFNSPSAVAFDQSGNLFVIDTNNNRVQKFTVNLDLGIYFSNADVNFYRGDNSVYSLLQAGNTLYLGGTFGLEAVDLTTGQQITWTPVILTGGYGTPQVYSLAYSAANNNILYVGSDNGLFEYDTSTSTGSHWYQILPLPLPKATGEIR
jgi:DNA-binding beta-propeller fold protein YncE